MVGNNDNKGEEKKKVIPKYLPVFHFQVSIEGKPFPDKGEEFFCQEVSGFSSEIPLEEIVEGGELMFTYKLPKTVKYKNLVMKHAVLPGSSPILNWVEDAVQNFNFHPCAVTVSLLGEDHKPVYSWTYRDAYPVKSSFSDMNSTSNQIVIETLELAYKFGKRVVLDNKE